MPAAWGKLIITIISKCGKPAKDNAEALMLSCLHGSVGVLDILPLHLEIDTYQPALMLAGIVYIGHESTYHRPLF
jgi:hypothetical protein